VECSHVRPGRANHRDRLRHRRTRSLTRIKRQTTPTTLAKPDPSFLATESHIHHELRHAMSAPLFRVCIAWLDWLLARATGACRDQTIPRRNSVDPTRHLHLLRSELTSRRDGVTYHRIQCQSCHWRLAADCTLRLATKNDHSRSVRTRTRNQKYFTT
jgi:hypothetical protein